MYIFHCCTLPEKISSDRDVYLHLLGRHFWGGASNKYLIYNKARYVFKAFFIQIPDSIQLFKKDT
jgi:hypothetical protein